MLGTGYFLKCAKNYSQQEKPMCPNHKDYQQFPQDTKDRDFTKIKSCKNFIPHGIFCPQLIIALGYL